MPDRRVAFSPGAKRGSVENDALCCPALLRHDAYLSPIYSFALSHGRSLIATSPHMAQLPRLDLLSLPHSLALSLSLSLDATDRRLLPLVRFFVFARLLLSYVDFFRFLFWRPLPKHSDDPRPSFSLPLPLFLLLLRRFFFVPSHPSVSLSHKFFCPLSFCLQLRRRLRLTLCPLLLPSPSASAFADCDF